MKKFIFSMTLILAMSDAYAQSDTLFWFAAPEVTTGSTFLDRPILLRLTSYTEATTVTISQPANAAFPAQVVNMAANSLRTIDLTQWIDMIESKPANTVLNFGLKIEATKPISAYYEVSSNNNPEIFVLKGGVALGVDFWIPFQTYIDNAVTYTPTTNSSFDIIATEDNTFVTITPSRNIVGHAASIPFTITLNAGQTYSATATSGLASQHPNGSRVTSNKPIAVTIKDDVMRSALFGTCADVGGDQLVPTPVLGRSYIAIKGLLSGPGDQVFVLATQDGTTVTQDGLPAGNINAGENIRLDFNGNSTFIVSNLPVAVIQLSGYGCEMGMAILPAINCTGSENVLITRSTFETFFINVLVPSGGQDDFLVNGNPNILPPGQFEPVPGTSGQWLAGRLSLNIAILPQGSPIAVRNTTVPFHLSVVHGGNETGTRFGYFSDYGTPYSSYVAASICEGEIFEGYGSTGVFTDSYESVDGCDSTRTIDLTVHPVYLNSESVSICSGESYLGYTQSGLYTQSFQTVNGCDSTFSLNLSVLANLEENQVVTICEGETQEGYSVSGTYSDDFLSVNGCDSTRILQLTVLPALTSNSSVTICEGDAYEGYNTSGTFVDTLQSGAGCDSIRTLQLTVNPAYRSLTSAVLCPSGTYDFNGELLAAGGFYSDTLTTVLGCDSILTLELVALSSAFLGPDTAVCFVETFTLESPNEQTIWFDNSVGPSRVVTESGTYTAKWIDVDGCAFFDTIRVDFNIEVYVPNAFSPNSDGVNDCFLPYFSTDILSNYRLSIFDRWGNFLFSTTDNNECWDGKQREKPCSQGVYVYYLEYDTPSCPRTVVKGDVTLLR